MELSYLEHVKEFGQKDTQIDRTNNNGNYCKENCKWVTREENSYNTRRSKKNRICQRCIELEKYKGLGWRRIAKLANLPKSTVIYHKNGHKNYHK